LAVRTGQKAACSLTYCQKELVHLPKFDKMHKTMAFGLFLFCIVFLTIDDTEGNRIPLPCPKQSNIPVNCNEQNVLSSLFAVISKNS